MKIESIVTLASKPVELMFLVMERSLRATGCELPLKVIPFDGSRFDLPPNAEWWEDEGFIRWIDAAGKRPVMRKYQVLLAENYQFVDTDVVFLRNPEEVLLPHNGFITSCGHWHNPGHTVTGQSKELLRKMTTLWPARIFNTGQFACDGRLYSLEEMKEVAEDPGYRETILENNFHEQPGINLMVNLKKIPVTNLTLPPYSMESTWAGDYPAGSGGYWDDLARKPYLIHWAGRKVWPGEPMSYLFTQYLTAAESDVYFRGQRRKEAGRKARFIQRLRRAWHGFCES